MEVESSGAERPVGGKVTDTDEEKDPSGEVEEKSNASDMWRRMDRGPFKRTYWNRSLSLRGRESIVYIGDQNLRTKPKQRGGWRKQKQKKLSEQLHDFSKEKAYFEELDAFELLEESPTPNKFSWKMGTGDECIEHDLSAILVRWRKSKIFSERCTAWPLSKIMETIPFSSAHTTDTGSFKYGVAHPLSQIRETSAFVLTECKFNSKTQKPTEEPPHSEVASNIASFSSSIVNRNLIRDFNADSVISSFDALHLNDEVTMTAVALPESNANKLIEFDRIENFDASLQETYEAESLSASEQLLMACGQKSPVSLSEAFLKYCDSEFDSIIKLGEGTYGEAFRVGETVCKFVPIDGDLLINGEIQKKSEEVLEEVLLSLTLNSLREQHDYTENPHFCTSFIETKDFRICKGLYDKNLIRAWEDWDATNNSENDHPCIFPADQHYIVFVLADGGKDLENFVLLNFNEAQSLVVQVMAALAVAEAACEFEHRDLHWGNILLRRNKEKFVQFILEGDRMSVTTFGLAVSIIDFTLSRINTGEAILFFNLSTDPELFKGPKGNVQFETYRRMKEVTGDCWEESFPKTNVLWLMYLVDILDKKKIYKRTTKDERNLRSFKRRLSNYESAKASLSDPFFTEFLDRQHANESASAGDTQT